MPKKLTTQEFIEKSIKIHNNTYDYSLVNYTGMFAKVNIICKKHGIFKQVPCDHIKGSGCKKCLSEINKEKYSKTKETFINESNMIHKYKYDYSLVVYKNNKTKVKIICPIHGVFEQIPNSHTYGNGCPKCRNPYKNKTDKLFNKFIEISNKTHLKKYDYSLVKYKYAHKKVKIVCPIHGVFEQTPNAHKKGAGCPLCKESKGEKKIRNFLINDNIKFTRQKKFNSCKNINSLPFDFFLDDYEVCIEFNGEQHYKPFEYFGGKEKFDSRLINDNIKKLFCKNNNIPLLIFFLKHDKSKEVLFTDLFENIPNKLEIVLLKNNFIKISKKEYIKIKSI